MIKHVAPDMDRIVGGWESKKTIKFLPQQPGSIIRYSDELMVIKNAISHENCDKLINFFFENTPEFGEVSIQGFNSPTDDANTDTGSMRSTLFDTVLSADIYSLFGQVLRPFNVFRTNEYTSTDCWQNMVSLNNQWSLKGISPMLRFMVYSEGGQHYPHYDAGYIYPNNEARTLKSFVLYLTTNDSGATRFIDDGQSATVTEKRNHNDWDRAANEETDNIIFKFTPIKGDMIIFNHRLCHDVDIFEPEGLGEKRIIIRGDLLY